MNQLPHIVRRSSQLVVSSLFSLFIFSSAWAEMDLIDALDLAMENDAVFRAAKFEYEAVSEAKIQARAALLPNIYYEYQNTETDQDINEAQNAVFNNTSSSFTTVTQGFTVNQTIFNYEQFQRYSQSKITANRADAEFEAAKQELFVRVSEAYFLVLERQDQLAAVRDEKISMERSLELAERKVARGLSRSVDADDARARYLDAVSREIELESYLMDAKYALSQSIGQMPSELLPLKDDVTLVSPEPKDPKQWAELASKNNPMLHAARLRLRESSKEITLLKGRHYPTVDLVYRDQNQDAGGSLYDGSSDVDTAEISLRVRMPIFAGFGVRSRVRQAAANKYKTEEDLRQAERSIERNTHDAWRRIGAAIAQIEALEQSVAAYEQMMEIKQRGYASGRYHILEMLDAQQDLTDARQSLTKARYDYALNTLRLKYEAGALTAGDIEIINGWLRGNAEYLPANTNIRVAPASEMALQSQAVAAAEPVVVVDPVEQSEPVQTEQFEEEQVIDAVDDAAVEASADVEAATETDAL